MFTQTNEVSSQVHSPAGAWSRTLVVGTFTTLWVFWLAVCAISTDFAFNFEPPPSFPFELRVFTSRMDFFADNRLPTTFKWRLYHMEVLLGRRQLPVAHSTASWIRSAAPPPILEYASISAGGKVIETLTSEMYSPPDLFAFFSRASRENSKHSPAVALTDGMEPGQCWSLRGESGQIGIQFARAIRLSSLVVRHANVPSESAASAPKKLVLWGLKSTDSGSCDTSGDEEIPTPEFGPGYCGIRLLSGIHNPLSSKFYQNFTISMHNDHYFDRIIIQVSSNWGHKAFTCIYRIQVYGSGEY